jgi:DNA polymerase-1
MPKTLYIIDGHAHIYAAYFAPMGQPLVSSSGEPTKATYIFTNMLLGLMERRKPDLLVVTMDAKGPTFRHGLYADYKANRPPMPEDLPPQIERIDQVLAAMRIPVLRMPGYEADDLMGTLAKAAGASGIETFICSGDKDVLQLLGERVSVYDVRKDIVITAADFTRDRGVTPEQFVDCLALQGDTADNVPGVPDVGPKTAVTWIQKYGSLKNLLAHAGDIKGKRGENLRAFADKLDLSKRLVTIDCQVALDLDVNQLSVQEFDRTALATLFTELNFQSLLAQIDPPPGAEGTPVARRSGPDSIESVAHDYILVDTEALLDQLTEDLQKQSLVAVDTETTSVHAMAADLVGISLAWEPHRAFYLPLRAPLGQPCLSHERVRARLGPLLADPDLKKVGQNIKYDLLILRNAGLPLAGVVFDTMIASYCLDPGRTSHSMDSLARDLLNYECIPIGELLGKGKNQRTFDLVDTAVACEYAAEDADVTFRLFELLRTRLTGEATLQALFENLEMPLLFVLADMEAAGVSLDIHVLRDLSHHIAASLEHEVEVIYKQAGQPFNIDSPKQLGEILFDRLGLPAQRRGKTGRSTDAAVLEQLAQAHPIVPHIQQYRQLSKLRNTYVDKLGALINARTHRVHTSFNQTVTATGRLSSSDPNLQNIPIRTELGRQIRGAFVAPCGDDSILSADYSQVELRLLAHFSRDPALCRAFADDQDIHRFVAAQVFGVDPGDVTSEMRSHSKAVNFGIIYGQGAYGLSRTTGMSMNEAKRFIEDYYARYGAIRSFMDGIVAAAEQCGYVETILGRRRQILDINSRNVNRRNQAHRFAVNTVIQGSAADLIKQAMIRIHRRIQADQLPVRLILQVHDELVFELPTAEIETHRVWIVEEMNHALELSVPLKVDISHGPNWLK